MADQGLDGFGGAAAEKHGLLYVNRLAEIQSHLRLLAQQPSVVPSIYRHPLPDEREELRMWEAAVAEWGPGRRARAPAARARGGRGDARRGGAGGGRGGSKPKPGGARIYTSRFRGVHQTFPTKRFEAQFRRSGKPTSLGCFDTEEQAARAYDKMMLWCALHAQPAAAPAAVGDAAPAGAGPPTDDAAAAGPPATGASPAAGAVAAAAAAGLLGGGAPRAFTTNFEASTYADDLAWLGSVSQDALIEQLRAEGRRQAAHRSVGRKRDSPGDDVAGAAEAAPLPVQGLPLTSSGADGGAAMRGGRQASAERLLAAGAGGHSHEMPSHLGGTAQGLPAAGEAAPGPTAALADSL